MEMCCQDGYAAPRSHSVGVLLKQPVTLPPHPPLLARLLFGGGGCCAGVRWVQAAPASCPKSAGACSNGQHISQRRAAALPAWDGKHKRAAVTQRGASVSSSRAGESQPSAVSWELEEEEEGRSRTPASTQMLC